MFGMSDKSLFLSRIHYPVLCAALQVILLVWLPLASALHCEDGDGDGLAVGVNPVLRQPPAPDRHPLAALQLPIRIVDTMLSRRE